MPLVRTNLKALTASDALYRQKFHLSARMYGFRIVTPKAVQIASFEKTVVRIPGPSCTEKRWMSKIVACIIDSSMSFYH